MRNTDDMFELIILTEDSCPSLSKRVTRSYLSVYFLNNEYGFFSFLSCGKYDFNLHDESFKNEITVTNENRTARFFIISFQSHFFPAETKNMFARLSLKMKSKPSKEKELREALAIQQEITGLVRDKEHAEVLYKAEAERALAEAQNKEETIRRYIKELERELKKYREELVKLPGNN